MHPPAGIDEPQNLASSHRATESPSIPRAVNLTKESEKLQTRYDSSLARKVTTECRIANLFLLGRVWSVQILVTPFVDRMIDAEHRGGPCKIGLPFPSRYEPDCCTGLRCGW